MSPIRGVPGFFTYFPKGLYKNKIKFRVALYRVGGRPNLILFLYSPLGKIGEKSRQPPYRVHN